MEVRDVIEVRRSIRAYRPNPVREEDLLLVLEAGRLAPTAVNKQPLCFIVLLGEQIARLKPVYDRDWFLGAPCVIVVCADHQSAWVRKDGKSYADVDAAIAMDHMILAAADRGLGSCWIGAFDRERACEALRLPGHVEPIVMTPLGYGVSRPDPKPRKSLEELTCWGVYGNKTRGGNVM